MNLPKQWIWAEQTKNRLDQILLIAEKADAEACKSLKNTVQSIVESRSQKEIRKTTIPSYSMLTPAMPAIPTFHLAKESTTTPKTMNKGFQQTWKISAEKLVSKGDLRAKRNELIQSIQTMKPSELYQLTEKLKNSKSILQL